MTSIADMVEKMLAEGASAAAIAIAVRALESVTSVTRDVTPVSRVTKRDGNRKRQAARRNRLKLSALAAEAQANDGANGHAVVTRDGVTGTNPPCDLLSIKEEGLSSEVRKIRKKEGTEVARARGTRIESGAPLTDEFRQAAIELGALAHEIPNAWAEFVDYWIGVPGSRGTKLDWLATWRNRVRDVLKRGNRNGHGTNGSRTNQAASQSGSAAIMAGVAAAAERRGRERGANGPGRQVPRDADAAREPDFEFGRAPDG